MTWQSQTIALLTASLVRPFALAAAAWLILRIFRVRHPASRHAVWTAVLIGMFLLPFVTVFSPHWQLPLLPQKQNTTTQSAPSQPAAIQPDESIDLAPPTTKPNLHVAKTGAIPSTETLIVWCYLAGLLAMAAYRLIGCTLLWRVLSRSHPLRARRIRESSDVLTPIAVGVLRPSVILPAEWRNWNASTKRAVLAHEFEHLRRRDTLVSAIARLAKCVFWFHPLAWWISNQLSNLAELSCDAAALRKIDDPAGYSRILLSFADTVSRSGHRAALPGLAIATNSGVSHRIDQIFEFAGGNMRKLSRPAVVLAMAGIPIMCLAATVGLTNAPTHAKPALVVVPSAPVEIAQAQTPTPPAPTPAPAPPLAPAPKPKFDVASIKPCLPGSAVSGRGGKGVAGNPSPNGMGGYFGWSPGRLNISCASVMSMVNSAYVEFGDPLTNDSSFPGLAPQHIRGVPGWAMDARYTIEATTGDPVANGPTGGMSSPAVRLMMGPMLRSLLEDRLQLKVHHDSEEIPMYALTVAKGGLKLKPMQDGDCTQLDQGQGMHQIGLNDKPYCGWMGWPSNGPNRGVLGGGVPLSRLADLLSTFVLDRHVIDRTGVDAKFNIRLEYAPDESTPCNMPGDMCAVDPTSTIPLGSSIFSALEQQLGLKLEPIKGPHGYIVIDHVEKPSEN